MSRAVFLDRDGVLIEDTHLIARLDQISILSGVPEALQRFRAAGFKLIVVSNQTVVSRGLATEAEVDLLNRHIEAMLQAQGGCRLDQFYICPHHPNATLPQYRVECDCRKPRPGLLLRAAQEHALDLRRSFMVGDRITDIVAGTKAGCRTVLVATGQHAATLIESPESVDPSITPDFVCDGLLSASNWILKQP
ncbi:MAG TPA: HAD family hydrolase [Verrucomicrobiae bacterium]|nr:HAD family hydrolase [Verrucomicrobiae bacterium]